MKVWYIIFVITAISFVFLTLYLLIRRYCKNKYYHSFIDDELFKEDKNGNATNYIYSTSNETKDYIPRYILRKSIYDRSVVLEYKDNFEYIEYFIKCFNRRGKVIEIKNIKERNTTNISKIINIPNSTNRINIFIKNVNNELELNTSEIRPITRKNIHLYSIISALNMFSLIYVIRHLVLYILLGKQFRPFLTSAWNYISLVIIIVTVLIFYIFTFFSVRRRNWKNKNRGAVRYEFY